MDHHDKVVESSLHTYADVRLSKMPRQFVNDVKKKLSEILERKLSKKEKVSVQVYDKAAKQKDLGICREPIYKILNMP